MNSDISEQAKQAIADGKLRLARQRLDRDGRASAVAVRRRVRCFAAEWNIPAAEIAPLMKGSSPNFNRICEFCEKHGASIDWIIGGDLKFLRQMKRDAQVAAAINNPGGLDASGMDTRILNIGRSLLELPPEKRTSRLSSSSNSSWRRGRAMSKAKKKPARKRSTKAAKNITQNITAVGAALVEKRAKAYHAMEPHLRDCERWSELAEVLSLDHDRCHYDMVVRHLAEMMEKLVAAYYEMGDYEQ
jgi:hypothetical protein